MGEGLGFGVVTVGDVRTHIVIDRSKDFVRVLSLGLLAGLGLPDG